MVLIYKLASNYRRAARKYDRESALLYKSALNHRRAAQKHDRGTTLLYKSALNHRRAAQKCDRGTALLYRSALNHRRATRKYDRGTALLYRSALLCQILVSQCCRVQAHRRDLSKISWLRPTPPANELRAYRSSPLKVDWIIATLD